MQGFTDQTSTSKIIRLRGKRLVYAGLLFLLLGAGLVMAYWQIGRYEELITRRVFSITEAGVPPVSAMELTPKNATSQSPILIVAHGFSGNKETMQAIGVESATRLDMRVFLFDFPGHGLSPTRYPDTVSDDQRTESFVATLTSVYNYAHATYPEASISLLGHSMGTGIVARFAQRVPDITSLILVSPANLPDVDNAGFKNLLVLVGDGDISQSIAQSKKVYAQSIGATDATTFPPKAKEVTGEEQGDLTKGTGLRLRVLSGTNHITILYTADSLAEINSWLDRSLFKTDGKETRAEILNDQNGAGLRLRWSIIGLIFSTILFFPAASFLCDALNQRAVLSRPPTRFAFSQTVKSVLAILVVAGVVVLLLTPLKPPQWLGLQLGSYLSAFFLLTGVGVWFWLCWSDRQVHYGPRLTDYSRNWQGVIGTKILTWVAIPGLLFFLVYFSLGLFSAASVESLQLNGARLFPFVWLFLSLLPFFTADEAIFRRMGLWSGYFTGLATKLGLIFLLFVAAYLSPSLGFITILLPVMALLFALFGFFSVWLNWLFRDFMIAGVLQALLFAWVISGLFPVS